MSYGKFRKLGGIECGAVFAVFQPSTRNDAPAASEVAYRRMIAVIPIRHMMARWLDIVASFMATPAL